MELLMQACQSHLDLLKVCKGLTYTMKRLTELPKLTFLNTLHLAHGIQQGLLFHHITILFHKLIVLTDNCILWSQCSTNKTKQTLWSIVHK
jgi:hypothetical protein